MNKISVIGLSGASVFLSVDHFHEKGETVTADSIFEEAGGKGFNQAVAAKRLGADAAFLSAIGRDGGGSLCRETLKAEGIEALLPEKDEKTAFAAILTDKSGENKVTVYRGALLDEKDVLSFEDHIASSDLMLLQLEVPVNVNLKAAAAAKKHNVPYILNPAPITAFTDEIRYLCENALFITPNESEAKVIFGADPENEDVLFEKFTQSDIKRAVVTLGDMGALIMMNGQKAHVPAEKTKAVDTTGAGDVFNGAFCVKLAEDISLCDDIEAVKKCAAFASKAASYSVRIRHVMASIPYRSEIVNNK